jgi:hypothetical protein
LNTIIKDYTKEIEKKELIIEKRLLNNHFILNTNKEHFEICV